jgi:hypothetical protein
MAREERHHEHEALKHGHKHYHVTHYLHRGENGAPALHPCSQAQPPLTGARAYPTPLACGLVR